MLLNLAGVIYSFGIFFKSLANEFGWSRTAISGIVTTYYICHIIGAIPLAWLSDHYGPKPVLLSFNIVAALGILFLSQSSSIWQVYLFYGVMVGFGFAATYAVLSSTTARWFKKQRGLALGISVCGVGIGTMLIAPMAERLIFWFGWRNAYLLFGIITFLLMVLPSLFIYKDPAALNLMPYGEFFDNNKSKDFSDNQQMNFSEVRSLGFNQVLRSLAFWIIFTIFFLFYICLQLTMTHLYNYATDVGISKSIAARFIALIGGCSIIGRLGVGIVSDHFNPKIAVLLCTLLIAASFVFIIFANSVAMFYIFAAIFGVAYGGEIPLIPVITGYFFGLESLGVIVASVVSAACLGASIGPLLGGIIFDSVGNYAPAFIIAAALSIVAVIFSLFLQPIKLK
jgi:MFS family permease